MSDIDLSLSDPTEIVHAVCDRVAGRRVRTTWSSDGGEMAHPNPDMAAAAGVGTEVVEVVGCVVVQPGSLPVVARSFPSTTASAVPSTSLQSAPCSCAPTATRWPAGRRPAIRPNRVSPG